MLTGNRNHKPVGPGKHFEMLTIMNKVRINTGKARNSREIWKKLNSLYDLEMLEETELFDYQTKNKKIFRN